MTMTTGGFLLALGIDDPGFELHVADGDVDVFAVPRRFLDRLGGGFAVGREREGE